VKAERHFRVQSIIFQEAEDSNEEMGSARALEMIFKFTNIVVGANSMNQEKSTDLAPGLVIKKTILVDEALH
jgi:hypothetical protein